MVTASTNNSERSNDLSAIEQENCSPSTTSSDTEKLISTPITIAEIAQQFRNANLSIIPIKDGTKVPDGEWEHFQERLATDKEINIWRAIGITSLGLVGGKISGNLEIIDFDELHNIDDRSLFERWKERIDAQYPGLVDRLPREKTRNNGFHVFYRCPGVPGNLKLSRREVTAEEVAKGVKEKSFTLVETRGEGGYVLCYPSPGYSIVNGSLTAIPDVTQDERDFMIATARIFNSYYSKKEIVKEPKSDTAGKRPGDVFNAEGDHRELLERHGWTYLYEQGENEAWCRPGKTSGLSATYHRAKKCFYVFSSNAAPLEPEQAYSNFSLFTFLEADGDYSEAAKKLAAMGYGDAQIVIRSKNVVGNGSKDPKWLIESTETYLNANYEFRKNIILGQVEMKEARQSDFYKMEDYELNSLHVNMLKQNFPVGHDMLKRFLDSDFVRKYDPFVEYFEELPAWDGTTDYLGQLASSVHLTEPREAQQFANNLMRWFIGYVATAIDPKAVNQAAIIFSGAQGIQKTRWFERIVPPKLINYQSIGIIDPDNKDTRIYLAECILINLDEMAKMKRTDIDSLKSLMTLNKIKVRRPYASFSEDMVRRASFVGSINATEFLDDPTGNRRFLVFEVESFDFAAIPDIDMVMAQAYSFYKAGERWWFEETEINQINERNKNHSVVSYEEELVLTHISKGTGKSWLTANGIAKAIKANDPDFRIDDRSVQKIGKALTKHKYESKKSNGLKLYNITTLTP